MNIYAYLSIDSKIDSSDLALDVRLTPNQQAILELGISANVPRTHTVDVDGDVVGDGLLVPINANPHAKVFCGATNLIVQIVDMKKTSIDPNLDNNIWVQEVVLACTGEILAFKDFSLQPLPPQLKLYSGVELIVRLKATIWNYGSTTIPKSLDGRLNIFIEAYLSPDQILDAKTDSKAEIREMDISIIREMTKQVGPNQAFNIDGIITLFIPLSACTSPYLLMQILPGLQITTKDRILDNNMRILDMTTLMKCSMDIIDFSVSSFSLPGGVDLYPEDSMSFKLVGRVQSIGDITVDSTSKAITSFQFYISRNKTWEAADRDLIFTGVDQNNALKRVYSGDTYVVLDSVAEKLVIPGDIQGELCGNVFLLAVMDNKKESEENSEYNNWFALPIIIHCAHGKWY